MACSDDAACGGDANSGFGVDTDKDMRSSSCDVGSGGALDDNDDPIDNVDEVSSSCERKDVDAA